MVFFCLLFFLSFPCEARSRKKTKPNKEKIDNESENTPHAQALRLLKIGVRLLRDGYYVGALDKFQRAYKLYPSPKIFFNIGQTQKELGRYVKAMEAYEKFLKQSSKDTSKEILELTKSRLVDLKKRIGTLKLEISHPDAKVTVNGTPFGASPLKAPIRLMPGSHSVVIKKPKYITNAFDIKLKAGQSLNRRVILKKPKKTLVKVNIVYKTVNIPKKGLALLWTGTALTATLGLTASILGGLALGEEKKMGDTSLSIKARKDAADRGELYAKITDGLLISGGVLAVGTLFWYLFYVRPSGGTKRIRVSPDAQAIKPSFDSGAAGFSLSF